ncbi:MBL fold metallo-hydrolase [Pseudonocardia zijingensis]|uniref:Metallo-beta-lactamase domain-containing protein n=1 Tax=Pseudonocardia zijingensis TaxID=153376 RepID=A0ABN1PMN9_9PSEU
MYELTILFQGFPGRSTCHGGLGWSTVALLRGEGRTVLVDTGGYGYRAPLLAQLEERGIARSDVTGVVLTHCHWDHICNFPLFPNAHVVVPRPDLEWAAAQPIGTWELPEYHVEELARAEHVLRAEDGGEPLPDVHAIATPGHTPGHFAYRVATTDGPVIFAGDAVKNEYELRTGEVDMTLDAAESRRSIEKVRDLLAADPALVLVPGHDRLLSLRDGEVVAHSQLAAGIRAWLPGRAEPTTTVDLA